MKKVEAGRKASGVRQDSGLAKRSAKKKLPDTDKARFNELLGAAVKPPKSSDQT